MQNFADTQIYIHDDTHLKQWSFLGHIWCELCLHDFEDSIRCSGHDGEEGHMKNKLTTTSAAKNQPF